MKLKQPHILSAQSERELSLALVTVQNAEQSGAPEVHCGRAVSPNDLLTYGVLLWMCIFVYERTGSTSHDLLPLCAQLVLEWLLKLSISLVSLINTGFMDLKLYLYKEFNVKLLQLLEVEEIQLSLKSIGL